MQASEKTHRVEEVINQLRTLDLVDGEREYRKPCYRAMWCKHEHGHGGTCQR
jgi:hypothetical protein